MEFIANKNYLPASTDPNGVFSKYNPRILRYPLQLIAIASSDSVKDSILNALKNRCTALEYIMIGSLLYVEYVPSELRCQVPLEKFEIIKYRNTQNTHQSITTV